MSVNFRVVLMATVAGLGLAAGCKSGEAPPAEPAATPAPTEAPATAERAAAEPPRAIEPPPPLRGLEVRPEFAGKRLAVVASGNLMGDVLPCGCRNKPQGGLARKASWLKGPASAFDARLLLDAGDLFHDRPSLSDEDRELAMARAELYLEAYGAMGHDAVAIGDRDLALGVPALLELAAASPFPFLSANLVRTDGSGLAFTPHVVVDKLGVKIGLFGLTASGRDEAALAELGLRELSPEAAARMQVKALRIQGARLIVALAHLPLDALEALAEAAPGIDLIVGSDSARPLDYPLAVDRTLIADVQDKGKELAVTTLLITDADLAGSGPIRLGDPLRVEALEQQQVALKERLAAREQALAKATAKEEAGEAVDNIDWLRQNIAKLRAEAQQVSLELEEAREATPSEGSLIAFDRVGMDPQWEDEPEIARRVAALTARFPTLAPTLTDEEAP